MALTTNSIQTQELNEYQPDETAEINSVILGWMRLYNEFDSKNEVELRDESYEIVMGLIEMRDNAN